jgi:ATP/maltotriose-dependent transcriptional regulator MalT
MTQVRDPLLETKLHVPRGSRGLVPRQRLRDRLSAGAESALTLISAPAGFGKTTLLTEWLAAVPGDGPSAGWLSLDEADNEPSLFWKYVVAALRSVAGKEIGASALSLLEASQAPIDAVLTALINDLFAVSEDVILVLDDYHVIEAPEVHDGVVFLLEHLPTRMHLIIASRADPPFSLARWRGVGGLIEIRAADLRFTPEESATYLAGTVGGGLTAQDVATLDQRTEGWIAALQLAALSMQGRDDLRSFIAGFAGDDRYIVDYLVEEVLQRQSEDVRQFLLQSSILDRLSGPLCDAVTGQANGGATLVTLERANLFLIPLDDRRRWYRYHHLFADVLRAHLLDEQPDNVAVLHSRASGWFERSGEPAEAIRHALAAEDFDTAANLAELAIRAMAQARQEATMRGWLKVLPAEVVRFRPVLTVGFAGALLLVV